MVGSPNSNNKVTPYQKFRSRFIGMSMSNAINKSPSRFRGVLPLENRKWGARISFNYKAHWLGTYQLEEEAAVAYDRAALKLQKSETILNLPFIMHTPQERSFQSWFSDDEIINMIKDKTYSLYYSSFLAHQSLARKTIPGSIINARGLSCRLLFHKELTVADVMNTKGLQIPKQYALQCFPPLGNSPGIGEVPMGSASVDMTFYDTSYASWNLRYAYWGSIKTFLFTKGWKHFVSTNSLTSGDTVVFYGCYHVDQTEGRRVFYMVDIHRKVPGTYFAGNGGGQGFGSRDNSGGQGFGSRDNSGGQGFDSRGNGGDNNNGVKLFGVVIG